ncbi:3-phosphoshikimate 1-carboxyvinyltransferase [Chromatocurvus halotolerans]|uniref:3-phosphoshikimate 1-carboxyvinyltransferase n=1 Tax=Chromatocurvus halotolerans TaxID=1132028 RepID=A0A4V6NPE6_9GAMM|nr:3-phosphoshikimate 1-carboxyvinyltransferase [Chromatocurvus halotolerans]TCO76120.1 3-phosphoshikimate 1-carboxyvinyltransferase [Chromatocurvus halotolerans]
MEFKLFPGGTISGEVRVPGDKSISHRSVMLSSIAEGDSRIRGFLEGEDALATLAALRALGVEIAGPAKGELRVSGVGLAGLRAPSTELDMGNSGTSMRLLSGLLAGQPFASRLTGDASLCRRPMARVMQPLARMGASITAADGDRPPLQIDACRGLQGIHYPMPIASAQVKSCLLLAGLYAEGCTSVTEPAPTRDHTERMLRGFGYEVTRDNDVIQLRGGGRLVGTDIDIPADISSAAFFIVAATIAPGSELLLTHVGVNPTRIGIISILTLMGADITLMNERDVGGEPVADILVRHAPLRGIAIPEDQVPLAIDEFPVLFIAAACAEGRTTLSGAEELRVKESDRIASMAEGLTTLGVRNEPRPDGIVIEGGALGGGVIHTHHDHRIAMAFAVAALRAEREIYVMDCDTVATSFPGFDAMARGLGLQISTQAGQA